MNKAFGCIYEGQPLSYEDLKETSGNLVEVIKREDVSSALETLKEHDNYTFAHSMRVAIYITIFARAEGLEDIQTIAAGGLIHDIGKAKIPLKILNKPGPYNIEEYEIMKKHVVYSREILSQSGVPEVIIVIGGDHHEKLDGTGYPNRLKGKEISLPARMAAIADAYGALTDKRQYKPAWPPGKALDMMANPPGHLDQKLLWQFKSKVVDKFL